ncbi:MAG: hypothetical protein WD045_04720 [Pirellulaceae bacterium]
MKSHPPHDIYPDTMDRPTEPNPPLEKPWPLTVDAKGPLALFALLGFVLLQGVLLILPFVRPGPHDTSFQLAQIGMVSFWLAAGVSPLATRMMVTAALLTWLASSSSGEYFIAFIFFLMACVSAGVGLIASLIFARGENRQFRLQDLLLMVSLYAVALAIMQNIAQGSEELARLPDAAWHLILLQIAFHGVLIGLCCVPLLARRGAKLRTFAVVLPLLVATMALEILISHTIFPGQLDLGNFSSAASFFFELVWKVKVPAILLVWLTLFPADYALNLFHQPPSST